MIITSLLDTDLYKFTMQQAVLHNYPSAWVKYKFKCRNNPNPLLDEELEETAYHVKLLQSEKEYLSKIRFLKPDYIEFLEGFRFNSKYIYMTYTDNEIEIDIEGPWVQTILFEVPLLAIISELYSKTQQHLPFRLTKNLNNKIDYLKDKDFKFVDMGTRRRYSYQIQNLVLEEMKELKNFIGTSNVHFAMKHNLKPIGTMAHEWVQAHQQITNLRDSQKRALDVWAHEYRGDLGIALSDTLGFNKFLSEFDLFFAKLYDGCRHDSGDPFEWTEKLIKHYEKLGIDPKTKTAVYSDGLNFEKAEEIYKTFSDKINVSFGIGTWLTNDVGITPPQIVIKMVEFNGYPVAKISDDSGKGMCENQHYLNYLKDVCERRN